MVFLSLGVSATKLLLAAIAVTFKACLVSYREADMRSNGQVTLISTAVLLVLA